MTAGTFDPIPTGTLYHYTSLEGLLGIVGSRTIRATHIAHLNDSAELNHAIELLGHAVANNLSTADADERKCLEQLDEWLCHKFLLEHLLFTCSFTEVGNLLSQWRAYSPPSGGVSLGFNAEELLAAAGCQEFQLTQCIYQRSQQEALVNDWLNAVMATRHDQEAPPSKRHPTQSYHGHFESHEQRFLNVAARLKHPTFAEEREWRLISKVGRDLRDPKLRFRAGKTRLIPYVEFMLPVRESNSMSLDQVYIGPAQDHNLSFSAITAFLTNASVRIARGTHASGIPLRNW